MFKKIMLMVILSIFVLSSLVAPSYASTKFHLGIVTGTVSQGEDTYRGGEKLVELYGDASKGGMIKHVTFPDNYMQEMETTISQISVLADDPKMKAIIVTEAVPGTAEAFRRVKEKRPDVLCFAGLPQEDPEVIASIADLVVGGDDIILGYLIPYTAKKMGADTFVHISFPRHLSYEFFARRIAIMRVACKDLGLKFVAVTAPDPLSDVGVAGAQQFILEKMPAWVNTYGKRTAFFTTNLALCEPMIRQIAKYGGFKADGESLLNGYPGAFGIDLKEEAGNWPAMLKKVEQAAIKAGAKKRMGVWPYSLGWTTILGLSEYAKQISEGNMKFLRPSDVWKCYEKHTPGATWHGQSYRDPKTNLRKKDYLLTIEDFYVFGGNYMNLTKVKVPEKYMTITK